MVFCPVFIIVMIYIIIKIMNMFHKKNSFNNETLNEHEIKQLKQYILEMEQEPKIYDELSEE